MHLRHRQTCRVCGTQELAPVLSLGDQHLQGSFVKEGKELPPLRRVPLELIRCDVTRSETACGLLQLRHSTPTEVLYAAYWYRSGTNATMRNHLRGIAEQCASMVGKSEARVLDIGCNDGTLLSHYPKGYRRFGVDPSDVALEAAAQDVTVVRDLFPSERLRQATKDEPFDIITSIAMFYDLEDPVAFVRNVRRSLAPDGLWVFEMSYMPLMLEMNAYDTICHEHLEYYHLAVLERIASLGEMRIFHAELNSINGGSIRCFASPSESFKFEGPEPSPTLAELRRKEFDLALDTDRPYRDFQDRINAHREELRALLKRLKGKGKRIHIYGASTKGNVILQFCGIDNTIIDFAAERNAEKHGARTLGTDIPIISEQESRDMRPDYYLVLPWHFHEEFVEREREMLAAGTAMIFPLPQIEIIGGG